MSVLVVRPNGSQDDLAGQIVDRFATVRSMCERRRSPRPSRHRTCRPASALSKSDTERHQGESPPRAAHRGFPQWAPLGFPGHTCCLTPLPLRPVREKDATYPTDNPMTINDNRWSGSCPPTLSHAPATQPLRGYCGRARSIAGVGPAHAGGKRRIVRSTRLCA